jgi:hypothetical protein
VLVLTYWFSNSSGSSSGRKTVAKNLNLRSVLGEPTLPQPLPVRFDAKYLR